MRKVGQKYNTRPWRYEGPAFMESNILHVRETCDNEGDILWSYSTRDRRFVGCSYDHAKPTRVAKRHNLVLRYVMEPRGWS